jgi:hypothetical protein
MVPTRWLHVCGPGEICVSEANETALVTMLGGNSTLATRVYTRLDQHLNGRFDRHRVSFDEADTVPTKNAGRRQTPTSS